MRTATEMFTDAQGCNFSQKVGVPLPLPSSPFTTPPIPSLPFKSRALNGAREYEEVLQDPPAGYGAEPQPPTHFCTISAPMIASCSA